MLGLEQCSRKGSLGKEVVIEEAAAILEISETSWTDTYPVQVRRKQFHGMPEWEYMYCTLWVPLSLLILKSVRDCITIAIVKNILEWICIWTFNSIFGIIILELIWILEVSEFTYYSITVQIYSPNNIITINNINIIIIAFSYGCPLYFSTFHVLSLVFISTLQGRDSPHFTNEGETQKGNQLAQSHKSSHVVQQLCLNPDPSATSLSALSFLFRV